MRIGLQVRATSPIDDAVTAEQHGQFGVVVSGDATALLDAAAIASATSLVRIITRIPLDLDHPITLAEDLAVLDNVSGGRVVALLDTTGMNQDVAIEAVTLVRAGLSARPVRHAGATWQVPAGIAGQDDVAAVQVTPEPVQVEVPVWLIGEGADQVAAACDVPAVATAPAAVDGDAHVQPASVLLAGDLEAQREQVTAWAQAGATHLLATTEHFDQAVADLAMHLWPSVAMPDFPRVISETMTPPPWPGRARYAGAPEDQSSTPRSSS